MSILSLQHTFAVNVAKLILRISESGYSLSLGEAWRTPEMAEIYANRGVGIKNSLHLKRLAIDINLFKDGVYLTAGDEHKPFGEYWESLHPANRWGGRFKDANHYEMNPA